MAVKRFSAEDVRHEAFGMLYVVQNTAVGLAMLTITAGRFAAGGTGLSPWRTVFLIVGVVAMLSFLLRFTYVRKNAANPALLV